MRERETLKELQRKIFELTLALYRVTDFFPQGEALRRNMREKANEVFSAVIEYGIVQDFAGEAARIVGRLESVMGYIRMARALNFVKPINLTVLERAYRDFFNFFSQECEKIEKEPEKAKSASEEPMKETLRSWHDFSEGGAKDEKIEKKKSENRVPSALAPISLDLNQRQMKILEHLKGVAQAKVSDFFNVFNDISAKTIQRDLQDLVSRNMLQKEGEKRWTTYILKDNVQ